MMPPPDPVPRPSTPASDPARWLLWVDCGGGLAVGAGMMLAQPWLEPWFRLPEPLYAVVAWANLIYGAFSLTLAARPRRLRPAWMIGGLALANVLWAVFCLVLLVTVAGNAGLLGQVHLFNEAVFVGTLGWTEWRRRRELAAS